MFNFVETMTSKMLAACVLPNPEWAKQERLLASGVKRWRDPKIPRELLLYRVEAVRSRSMFAVPAGVLPKAMDAYEGRALPAHLRDYQREAVAALVPWDCGLLVAPCGAGKTQVGCGILQHLDATAGNWPSLVVVHTKDLAAQWVARLKALGVRAYLACGTDAFKAALGAIAERADYSSVVVSTVQTLARQEYGGKWNVVIVDEAHHVPATTWTGVLARLDWSRIYGLTATPDRADGMTAAMLAWLGPIRYSVDRALLQAEGNTVLPAIVRVDTGAFCESSDFGDMVGELTSNAARNALIARTVRAHGSWPQMVLTSRVEHAECLAVLLSGLEAGGRVAVMTGGTKGREAILDDARAGRIDVLIATQLADEGLDVPGLCAVHLAAPSRAAGRIEQRVGRIMRPAAGKGVPVVYDYVDDDSLMLSQWRSRWKVYKSIGCKSYQTRKVVI